MEYSYLDILCKLGWTGLILFFLPYLLCLWRFARTFMRKDRDMLRVKVGILAFCGVVGAFFAAIYNPWMGGFSGLALYFLCEAGFSIPEKTAEPAQGA